MFAFVFVSMSVSVSVSVHVRVCVRVCRLCVRVRVRGSGCGCACIRDCVCLCACCVFDRPTCTSHKLRRQRRRAAVRATRMAPLWREACSRSPAVCNCARAPTVPLRTRHVSRCMQCVDPTGRQCTFFPWPRLPRARTRDATRCPGAVARAPAYLPSCGTDATRRGTCPHEQCARESCERTVRHESGHRHSWARARVCSGGSSRGSL